MNYKKSKKLSTTLLILALVVAFSLYFFKEPNALFYVLLVMSVALFMAGIIVQIIFYRCPHCRGGLPWRSFLGKYCQHCGKELDS